jgi:hypothetical protein
LCIRQRAAVAWNIWPSQPVRAGRQLEGQHGVRQKLSGADREAIGPRDWEEGFNGVLVTFFDTRE